jgi:methionyl-tRNA synthetase
VEESLMKFRIREALAEAMNLVRLGNKYLTDKEPWKLFNTNPEKTGHVLNVSLQLIAGVSILLQPFLPDSSKKIFGMLNLSDDLLKWTNAGKKDLVPAGHQLEQPEILFTKIEDAEILAQVHKLHTKQAVVIAAQSKSAKETPVKESEVPKPEITYDDFSKLELRIGTIEAAEKVKKADKLLQLKVNLGTETRTIVSGIAEHYSPENIIGQQVCVVTNLAPRKIKGIESKGMILMAEDADGKLRFVMPSEWVGNGSGVS